MIITELRSTLAYLLEQIDDPYNYQQNLLAIEQLAAKIESIPELSMFNNEQRLVSHGSHGLSSRGLAYDLILRASDTTLDRALADLHRYVNSSTMKLRKMLFVGGIQFDGAVDFGNGITAAPFSAETRPPRLYNPGFNSGFEEDLRVDALLWEDLDFPVVHGHTDVAVPDFWDFSALDDVRLCLSLAGPSGPVQIGTSIAATEWIPCFGPLGEVPHREESRSCARLSIEEIEYAADAHRLFLERPTNHKKQLRIALERLNWAKRRRWEVDQAIDLGIACEATFGAERPFDASINFTLRIRAAYFLGTTYSERERIYSLLSDLYSLRSSAVHRGNISESRGERNVHEIMDAGCILVRDALYKILHQGEPNWTEVVLGRSDVVYSSESGDI